MKILRSQYKELRSETLGQRTAGKIKAVEKEIPHNVAATNNGSKQLATAASKGGAQPIGSLRRASVSVSKSTSDPLVTNIKILFDNVDESLKKLNVVVEFTDMGALWLTKVYRTYENELWHRVPRLDVFGTTKKWCFFCHLCESVYMEFMSLKNHLNRHFKLFPYVCKLCARKYTGRKAATSHLKSKHNLYRDEWNDYLTS